MTLASVGGGAAIMGALIQKMPMPPGSRRRMTPLSRSDPVLRFVQSRQRFVRWSQAPRHGGSGLAPDFPSNQPRSRSTLTLMNGTTFPDGVGHVGIVGMVCIACCFLRHRTNVASAPSPVKKTTPGIMVSQSCGLSYHQNNMNTPTLNQRALRMKWPPSRWISALSHAATVRQKASQ